MKALITTSDGKITLLDPVTPRQVLSWYGCRAVTMGEIAVDDAGTVAPQVGIPFETITRIDVMTVP